jgi:hypothetical protein
VINKPQEIIVMLPKDLASDVAESISIMGRGLTITFDTACNEMEDTHPFSQKNRLVNLLFHITIH